MAAPSSRTADVRARRARAVAALIAQGWKPPPLRTEQTDALLDDMQRMGSDRRHTFDLTGREVQHLKLASKGLTEDLMAKVIGLSPDTVKHRSKAIRRKLGAKSTTHAVAIALREGIIE